MGIDGFDAFYRAEIALLVAFVRRAGFTTEQAQDAAQEAMIQALAHWGDVREPRAWARVVAYNFARREVARFREGSLRAVAGGWAVAVHQDPDLVVMREEHDQMLRDLATLSPQRRLVMAWHLDGFDALEISDQLRIAPATARSHLRHARAALKSRFELRQGPSQVEGDTL